MYRDLKESRSRGALRLTEFLAIEAVAIVFMIKIWSDDFGWF